jgi:hypothetical protein
MCWRVFFVTGYRGAVEREAPLFSVTYPCLMCFQLLHPNLHASPRDRQAITHTPVLKAGWPSS